MKTRQELNKKIENLIRKIKNSSQKLLKSRYTLDKKESRSMIINEIVYNEKTRLVAIFKDYLIYDDISEFLKRYYVKSEVKSRLIKISEFYNSYSKIFPNYTIISEAKYIYKNIQRKQKIIDIINKNRELQDHSIPPSNSGNDPKIFKTDVYNSIMEESMNNSNSLDFKNLHKKLIIRDEGAIQLTEKTTNQSFEHLIKKLSNAEEVTQKILKFQSLTNTSLKEKPIMNNYIFSGKMKEQNYNSKDSVSNNSLNLQFNEFKKKSKLNPKLSPNKKNDFKNNDELKYIKINRKLNINTLLSDNSNNLRFSSKNKETFNTKVSDFNLSKERNSETEKIFTTKFANSGVFSLNNISNNQNVFNQFNIVNNYPCNKDSNKEHVPLGDKRPLLTPINDNKETIKTQNLKTCKSSSMKVSKCKSNSSINNYLKLKYQHLPSKFGSIDGLKEFRKMQNSLNQKNLEKSLIRSISKENTKKERFCSSLKKDKKGIKKSNSTINNSANKILSKASSNQNMKKTKNISNLTKCISNSSSMNFLLYASKKQQNVTTTKLIKKSNYSSKTQNKSQEKIKKRLEGISSPKYDKNINSGRDFHNNLIYKQTNSANIKSIINNSFDIKKGLEIGKLKNTLIFPNKYESLVINKKASFKNEKQKKLQKNLSQDMKYSNLSLPRQVNTSVKALNKG